MAADGSDNGCSRKVFTRVTARSVLAAFLFSSTTGTPSEVHAFCGEPYPYWAYYIGFDEFMIPFKRGDFEGELSARTVGDARKAKSVSESASRREYDTYFQKCLTCASYVNRWQDHAAPVHLRHLSAGGCIPSPAVSFGLLAYRLYLRHVRLASGNQMDSSSCQAATFRLSNQESGNAVDLPAKIEGSSNLFWLRKCPWVLSAKRHPAILYWLQAKHNPLVVIPGGPGLPYEYLETLEGLCKEDRMVVEFDPIGTGSSSPLPEGAASADLVSTQAVMAQVRKIACWQLS